MRNNSNVIIDNINGFLKLFKGVLSSPQYRAMRESIEGLMKKKTMKLSEIARSINGKTSVKHHIKRLSYQLSSNRWDDEGLKSTYVNQVATHVKKDTLIVIDIGDIRKEYGKRFEYLAEVWDGSKKEKANGYWRLDIIAQGKKRNRDVYPLVNEIYSQQDPNFTSRNSVILRSLELVFNATDKRGILVGDRDFDFKRLYKFCCNGGIRFIIRQKGNRDILGSEERNKEILKGYIHKIGLGELKLLEFKGKMKYFYLRYFKVKLPGMKEQFWVVVYKGARSKEPVILLTNIPATDESKAWGIAKSYILRWRIEETERFMKQGMDIEGFMVRKFVGIKRLMFFAMVVFYLLYWFDRFCKEISDKWIESAKGLKKEIKFVHYRLLYGFRISFHGFFS
jgi:hypothetical protein